MDHRIKCKILNIEAKLNDLGLDNDFLDVTSKALATTTTTKIDKLYLIRIKCFLLQSPRRWKNTLNEKIFANHVRYKGLGLRIFKESLQVNNKNIIYPI